MGRGGKTGVRGADGARSKDCLWPAANPKHAPDLVKGFHDKYARTSPSLATDPAPEPDAAIIALRREAMSGDTQADSGR